MVKNEGSSPSEFTKRRKLKSKDLGFFLFKSNETLFQRGIKLKKEIVK